MLNVSNFKEEFLKAMIKITLISLLNVYNFYYKLNYDS